MGMVIDFTKMGNFIVGAIFLILLVFLGFYIDRKQAPKIRKRVEELYLNGNIAIGTVSSVTGDTYGNPIVLGCIYYRFEASVGITYTNLGGALPKQISAATDSLFQRRLSTGISSGDKFLVIYDENDPKNAILLLDHPINSEEDFARYVAAIEELRKDPKWRGYK